MTTKIKANDAYYRVQYSAENIETNRELDDNNFMLIKNCVLTAEEVSDYIGKQITNHKLLGLDPNKMYGIYRPIEEIEKAVDKYNDLVLTDNHVDITPEKPARERWFGLVLGKSKIENGQLLNDIKVIVKKAIDEIEAATKNPATGRRDLSVGYTYDLILEEGEFNGKHYHFKMVNICPNHVALVKEARVDGAKVADQKTIFTRGVNKVKFNLSKFLTGLLATDSRAMDTEARNEAVKGIISMARDEDYEGKEDKLINEIGQIIEKLGANQKAEKAADNESEEERKKREAKDNEDKEKAKDNEEKEKEKAADSAVKQFGKIISLSTKVLGRISPAMLDDANPEKLLDSTLKVKGIATDSKTLEVKLSLLEALAAQPQNKPQNRNTTGDSRSAPSGNKVTMRFNPLERKK